MTIKSTLKIEGFCKKKKNQDIYCYPETPAMAYRLFRAGVLKWSDHSELKELWDDQLEAIKIAREYYELQTRTKQKK